MHSLYISQFLTVVFVHLLAVVSPGPDFAVVMRQALTHGRRIALFTSFGVGMGILIHVSYSLLGIGVVISQSLMLFTIMKIAGALYLIYIGGRAIGAGKAALVFMQSEQLALPTVTNAVWTGLLTNGLNPKATLFFLALFTVVISPDTPLAIQALYGAYMALATALWFCLVALFFGHERMRVLFGRFGHWF